MFSRTTLLAHMIAANERALKIAQEQAQIAAEYAKRNLRTRDMIATCYGRKIVRILQGNQEFDLDETINRRSYMRNPSAFWLRPDGDFLSDEPFVHVLRYYDVHRHQTYEVPAEHPDEIGNL